MTQKRPAGIRAAANYVNATIVEAVVLLVIGVFAWLLMDGRALLRLAREQLDVLVELRGDASDAQRDSVMVWLQAQPWVKPGSVELITRDEAARMMQEELGADLLEMDMPNPFFDVVRFHVASDHFRPEFFSYIRTETKQLAGVRDVFYQQDLVVSVARNVTRLGWAFALLALLLALVAATVVYHTTRLALYANRFLIKNMELIGATWGFIARPFLVQSAAVGAIAGTLAALGVWALMGLAEGQFPELAVLQTTSRKLWLFSALIAGGALLNVLSAWLVVHQYLRMRVDDLYG